jgi:molybdate transport system substrate-binding protein
MPRRICACAAALAMAAVAPAAADVTVFAASSLTDAVENVGRMCARETGLKLRVSVAGSGALARQIELGAPADIFISADEEWMDYLESKSRIEPGSRTPYLTNRLVLIAPEIAPEIVDETSRFDWNDPQALVEALTHKRLSMGEPESVPAGRYAREALEALGIWSGISDRIAAAENVRVALAWVARGETPFGIVYRTDARVSDKVRIVSDFPTALHAPIRYPIALIAGQADADAQKALACFLSDDAKLEFVSFGFIDAGAVN